MNRARLSELYTQKIRSHLQKTLGLSNVMQVPKINKIVVNVGVKEAVADSKSLQSVIKAISAITGQTPVRTYARKSIAGFKLREGMPIGVKVTLRGQVAYEYLDRLINLALPKVRDFRGVPRAFDGRGNYNLGLRDWTIFPEMDHEIGEKMHGMNVTIETSASCDEHGRALLQEFGMPFCKERD
ncbi:50S ribosomal protein L5 [Candidatus Dependentiae bacterium]|nr:50S ribosomal protein L5 [Candidatus Dependentiae bacterium]MCC7415089.1 50S ribosomal protein L5 [Campylobacterota bacterium]